MMFRTTRWTLLFAALLLSASPAWAQDEEEPDPQEPAEVIGEESDEDTEAIEQEEQEDDEVGEEPREIEEPPQQEEPAPVEAEETTTPEKIIPQQSDEQESLSEQPVDETYEPPSGDDPMQGAAISPARTNPQRGVRVAGNTDDDPRWSLDIGGYIRGGYTRIQDGSNELFGRNDGFVLSDARLNLHGSMNNGLGFVFGLDAGSRLIRTTPESPVEELTTRMTDTYIYYAPFEFLEFNLGQFKAPYDAEDLLSAADLLFVDRSVANRGVQNVEGFNVEGLGQGRQIGLQARGSVFPLADDRTSAEGPGISYAAAVVNGNGANRSLNNNDRPAYFGRLALHWEDLVSIGGGAFYEDSTFGEPPNRVDRTIFGWTADLQVKAFGATLLANVMGQDRAVPDLPEGTEVSGLGYQVQVGYEEPFFGLQLAYRYAFFDPTAEPDQDNFLFDNDARTHHTFGVNYNAEDYPLRLIANYTIALEEDAVQLDNDRLDLFVQLQW